MRTLLGLFLLVIGCSLASEKILADNDALSNETTSIDTASIEEASTSELDTLLKDGLFATNGLLCMTVRRANVSNCPTDKSFNLTCIEEHVGKFSNNTPKGCGLFYLKSLEYCKDKIPTDTKLKCRVIPVA